jgi:hypothetical protein
LSRFQPTALNNCPGLEILDADTWKSYTGLRGLRRATRPRKRILPEAPSIWRKPGVLLSLETQYLPVLSSQPVHGLRLILIHLEEALTRGIFVRAGAGNKCGCLAVKFSPQFLRFQQLSPPAGPRRIHLVTVFLGDCSLSSFGHLRRFGSTNEICDLHVFVIAKNDKGSSRNAERTAASTMEGRGDFRDHLA